MNKEEQFGFGANWLELWMKQSKTFFDSANHNLNNMFAKSAEVNPEEHLQQINQWLDMLKQQWQFSELAEQQKAYQHYWTMMGKMCSEASDLMLEQWIKRTREENPIHNVRELYELWLNCCHEIYLKAMKSDAYPKAYSDMMNASFKLWQDAMGKK